MEIRPKRRVVGAKFSEPEKRLVETAAAAEGITVSAFVHRVVLPAARERVAREFDLTSSTEAALR